MATINFTTSSTTFSIAINGVNSGTWDKVPQVDEVYDVDIFDHEIVLSLKNPYLSYALKEADTVSIDGTSQSWGNVGENIKAVCFTANPGSGGSGTPVLQSPNGTLYQLGVNDSGALQTVQVSSGTAGTLHLFSPDNTEWNVTVSNAGALITTAI